MNTTNTTPAAIDGFTFMVAQLYYGDTLLNSMGEKDYLSIVDRRLLKGYSWSIADK